MKEKSEEGKIVFVSYAHEDDSLRNELEKHLSLLKQQHLIKTWHNQNISAGTEWEREIHTYLNKADIILLLISPDFMASRYCFSVEMERAMERHECGDAQVIPIIVRPVDWQSALFGKLQALPAGAKPIQSSQWHYVDEALFSVVEGIRKVIKASLWKEVEPHHTLFSLKGNEISNASPAVPLDQIQTQTFLNGTEKDFSVLQTRHESLRFGSQDQTLVADQQPVQEHDFYISYTRFDEQWAQWIASQLEDSGYTCYVKAWDLLPGHNYAWETDQAMKQAKRVIAVVSPIYLDTMAEWTAAQGQQLVPVIAQECTPRGWLGTLVSINLVGKDENAAKKILLHELALTRRKPALGTYPGASFPGKSVPANIPHPNAYFTGRTTELRQLHTQLEQQQRMAISGLGGIGKTQLALAYAHSHLATYNAVLWMNADNTAALNTSCNEIAELLHLPEASASEQKQIVAAVKRWLIKNRNYLLILDNVEDTAILDAYLPGNLNGYVLFTSRDATIDDAGLGLGTPLSLRPLLPESAAHLLLTRSRFQAQTLGEPEPERQNQAISLALDLGCLPLALDQAGAYIASCQISISEYHELFRQHQTKLLSKRYNKKDHPDPVTTTWSLSFEAIAKQNPAASELLCICAFLAPNAIPEYFFTKGANAFGPILTQVIGNALLFNDAIAGLRRYSLIDRDGYRKTLSVHRLVQVVIRDSMSEEEMLLWLEKAINGMEKAFPHSTFDMWKICQELLSHAKTCVAKAITLNMIQSSTCWLLSMISCYLVDRGEYDEAQQYGEQAIEHVSTLKDDWHMVSLCYNNLSTVYLRQGDFDKAKVCILKALEAPEHADGRTIAPMQSTISLGSIYRNQKKYAQAEDILIMTRDTLKSIVGEKDTTFADCLMNLGNVYADQSRFTEAEAVCQKVLSIRRSILDRQHPDVARSLINLALVYKDQDKFSEAVNGLLEALTILCAVLQKNHPDIALCLMNLAIVYEKQGNLPDAEKYFRESLAIMQAALKPQHPAVITCLRNLALICCEQGKFSEAANFFRQLIDSDTDHLVADFPLPESGDLAELRDLMKKEGQNEYIGVFEQSVVLVYIEHNMQKNHITPQLAVEKFRSLPNCRDIDIATNLNKLGNFCHAQKRFAEASAMYEQAIELLLPTPSSAIHYGILHNLANTYCDQGVYAKAIEAQKQAITHVKAIHGDEHPESARFMHDLAAIYLDDNQFTAGIKTLKEALTIFQTTLGDRHLDTLKCLSVLRHATATYAHSGINGHLSSDHPYNMGQIYFFQNRFSEARASYLRALEMLSPQDTEYVGALYNLARISLLEDNVLDAETLLLQALSAQRSTLGSVHPGTAKILSLLGFVYKDRQRFPQALAAYQEAHAIYQQCKGSFEHEARETRSMCKQIEKQMKQQQGKNHPLS